MNISTAYANASAGLAASALASSELTLPKSSPTPPPPSLEKIMEVVAMLARLYEHRLKLLTDMQRFKTMKEEQAANQMLLAHDWINDAIADLENKYPLATDV